MYNDLENIKDLLLYELKYYGLKNSHLEVYSDGFGRHYCDLTYVKTAPFNPQSKQLYQTISNEVAIKLTEDIANSPFIASLKDSYEKRIAELSLEVDALRTQNTELLEKGEGLE